MTMKTKYELMNKQQVHANFWVEDGIIVKTEPILSWILGWTMEQLEAWSDDVLPQRKLYITRLDTQTSVLGCDCEV